MGFAEACQRPLMHRMKHPIPPSKSSARTRHGRFVAPRFVRVCSLQWGTSRIRSTPRWCRAGGPARHERTLRYQPGSLPQGRFRGSQACARSGNVFRTARGSTSHQPSQNPNSCRPVAVGAKRHTGHRVGMAGQRVADQLSGGRVPQPHRLIPTAGGEALSGRRSFNGRQPATVLSGTGKRG